MTIGSLSRQQVQGRAWTRASGTNVRYLKCRHGSLKWINQENIQQQSRALKVGAWLLGPGVFCSVGSPQILLKRMNCLSLHVVS